MISDLSKMTEVREVPLRSTFMSDSERCPRRALLRHRAGLVSRSHFSGALYRGDIMHRIIAEILRGATPEQAEDTAQTRLAEASQVVVDSLTDAGYTPTGQTPEEAFRNLETKTKVAIAMSRAYRKFFGIRAGEVDILVARPDSSESFIRTPMPVYENGVERRIHTPVGTGDLDAVLINEPDQLYVLDHKTCGMDIERYVRTLPLTAQTLLYPRLVESLCFGTSLRIAGIIYNVIRTPTIYCCKTDDYDLDKYAARVEQWYRDGFYTKMAQTIIRPSPELNALSEPRIRRAASYCTAPPLLANFPAMGGSSCLAYNTLCPFIGLCTTDTSLWPERLEQFDRDFRDDLLEPTSVKEESK